MSETKRYPVRDEMLKKETLTTDVMGRILEEILENCTPEERKQIFETWERKLSGTSPS